MRRRATRRTMRGLTILGLAAAAVLVVLSAFPADAKKGGGKGKPPKPPPAPPPQVDAGQIYYVDGQMLHRMNPDGSGKTAVIGRPDVGPAEFRPSLLPHGGKRWFLLFERIAGETYADGKDRFELFAVTAEGDAVKLTDDPRLEPTFDAAFPDRPTWAVHDGAPDGKVSFLATLWGQDGLGNDVVVDHGVYWFPVDPDDLTVHAPVACGAGGEFLPLELGLRNGRKIHAQYGWSPSGIAVVFVDFDVGPGLRTADEESGWDPVQLTTDGEYPRWSPDGNRIAFWDPWDYQIHTVRPDGTDRRQIASRRAGPLCWSPSGTYAVHWTGSGGKGPVYPRLDVKRVTADGGNGVSLTGDIGGRPAPIAWVASE